MKLLRDVSGVGNTPELRFSYNDNKRMEIVGNVELAATPVPPWMAVL
jgi:hypothetical protein